MSSSSLSNTSSGSAPSLFPIVCDLTDVDKYINNNNHQRDSSGSFSSSSFSNRTDPLCAAATCPHNPHHHTLDFSFADLCEGTLQHLIEATNAAGSSEAAENNTQSSRSLHELRASLVSPSTNDEDNNDEYYYSEEGEELHYCGYEPSEELQEASEENFMDASVHYNIPKGITDHQHQSNSDNSKFSHWLEDDEEEKPEGQAGGKEEGDDTEDPANTVATSTASPVLHPSLPPRSNRSWREAASSFFRKSSKRLDTPNLFQVAQGFQSVLWECEKRSDLSLYWCKIFSWSDEAEKMLVTEELDLWRHSNHYSSSSKLANVLGIYEDVENRTTHLVLERCWVDGPTTTLQSLVLRHGKLSETQVKHMVRDMLVALKDLGRIGIGYNQILPSSVVTMSSQENYGPAVFIDLGSATLHNSSDDHDCSSHRFSSDSFARSAYAAPELLHPSNRHLTSVMSNFSDHRDDENTFGLVCHCCGSFGGVEAIWSVGVVMHYCLFGHVPPFLEHHHVPAPRFFLQQNRHSRGEQQQRRSHHSDGALYLGSGAGMDKSGDVGIPQQQADSPRVSRQAKQFMSACLNQDPTVRITLKEALEHPWIKKTRRSHPHHNGNCSEVNPQTDKRGKPETRWWRKSKGSKSRSIDRYHFG